MRICFVGHSFHGRTGSSRFFRDILRELGEVTELTSSPDEAASLDDAIVEHFASTSYDLWVFWQTEYVAERLVPFGLRNAVIAPMYDGAVGRPDAFFQRLVNSRFLSFSRELHARLQRLNCRSAAFTYWPEPTAEAPRADPADAWSGYLWERRPFSVPHAGSVLAQCKALGIRRLHVHAAPDFPAEGTGVRAMGVRGRLDGVEVTTSSWSQDAAAARAKSREATFYFAPRATEGIGLSFLEAMAAGQVVVAPDRPTMNEYVGHLSSGILYDPAQPTALPAVSEARVAELSAGALARATAGRQEWLEDVERLKSFVLDDGRRWAATDSGAHFANLLRQRVRARRLKALRD